jgi:hypothetical protein
VNLHFDCVAPIVYEEDDAPLPTFDHCRHILRCNLTEHMMNLGSFIYVWMMYECISISIYLSIYLSIYMYVCMYVCMYVFYTIFLF